MSRAKVTVLAFVRSVWESFRSSSGLEPRLLDKLRIMSASHGRVKFELDIAKEHTNRLSILHGGTIASMVDLGGSLAVASKGLYSTGVSTDLNVTYLSSGGAVGDKITATAECDKIGKNLAFTSITFANAKGAMFARGSHTKYIAAAIKDEKNMIGQLEEPAPHGDSQLP